MYDFSFDKKQLEKELQKSDFSKYPLLNTDTYKSNIINQALDCASSGFGLLSLRAHIKNKKVIYQTDYLHHELTLRKLSRNIKRLTGVGQSNREDLIRSLKTLMSDGCKMQVYKLDIKSFYESVNRGRLEEFLSKDLGLPASSLLVFRELNKSLDLQGIQGLPRGLTLSSTLAEYLLRNFDRNISLLNGVYFYGRYVDDVVIITTDTVDSDPFMNEIRKLLPAGLRLNHGKTKIIGLMSPNLSVSNAAPSFTSESFFDFLGYRFYISHKTRDKITNEVFRQVKLDIAPAKVSKIKTRISKSLQQYCVDNNFDDLRDRFKVLTGNYNMFDYEKRLKRNVGISYNYRHIDVNSSDSVVELDKFIPKILFAKTGSLANKLRARMTTTQRNELVKFRFSQSFKQNAFYHFNGQRLAHLAKCWNNG